MSEAAVRAAFTAQAGWCETLGSPFTSRLCATLADRLDRETVVGRRVLDWPGLPDALHDSVPLRLAGALNALVRRGHVPDLAALYPPHPVPEADRLWAAVDTTFRARETGLLAWLDLAPQTNEVARSAVLIAGLAVVAAETGMPIALHELGASAGLNLVLDRYACQLGSRVFGDPRSALKLAPAWTGESPPAAKLAIASRRGVDLNPLDVTDPAGRERLLAYVWPDQAERVARLEAALAIALRDPPALDAGDAADWMESEFEPSPATGLCRVVMHSIAFQYFPARTQARVAAWIERAGAMAAPNAPVAWLRYEADPEREGCPSLRLRIWPEGENRVLAHADAHGRAVTWLAAG